MNSLVNYSVENEYVDVANNVYSKSIPRTENENYKNIQRLRMKVNFWILIYSIIILILVFLLGYNAKGQIFPSNNENGTYFYIVYYQNKINHKFLRRFFFLLLALSSAWSNEHPLSAFNWFCPELSFLRHPIWDPLSQSFSRLFFIRFLWVCLAFFSLEESIEEYVRDAF